MSTDLKFAQLESRTELLTSHRLHPAVLWAKQNDDIANDLEQGSSEE